MSEVWKASRDVLGNSERRRSVSEHMKRTMVGVVCSAIVSCVVLTSAAFGADEPRKETVQRTAFKAGGAIYLHLGAGDADVVVKPGTSEIVVTTKTKEAETKDTRVSVKV